MIDGCGACCCLSLLSGSRSAVVRAVSVGKTAPTSPSLGLLTLILPPVLGWQVVVLTICILLVTPLEGGTGPTGKGADTWWERADGPLPSLLLSLAKAPTIPRRSAAVLHGRRGSRVVGGCRCCQDLCLCRGCWCSRPRGCSGGSIKVGVNPRTVWKGRATRSASSSLSQMKQACTLDCG